MRGISSGIQQDLHGEKMTEKCIKSFHDQASSGDILLYKGKHGVDFTEDIRNIELSKEGLYLLKRILPNITSLPKLNLI